MPCAPRPVPSLAQGFFAGKFLPADKSAAYTGHLATFERNAMLTLMHAARKEKPLSSRQRHLLARQGLLVRTAEQAAERRLKFIHLPLTAAEQSATRRVAVEDLLQQGGT